MNLKNTLKRFGDGIFLTLLLLAIITPIAVALNRTSKIASELDQARVQIEILKTTTAAKFEAASYLMDRIQEKLPPPVSPREVSQFEPKRIGTREKLLVESGGAYSEVAYIEGLEMNGSIQAQRIVVRSNFAGVVYVQRKNGSFEVVYP